MGYLRHEDEREQNLCSVGNASRPDWSFGVARDFWNVRVTPLVCICITDADPREFSLPPLRAGVATLGLGADARPLFAPADTISLYADATFGWRFGANLDGVRGDGQYADPGVGRPVAEFEPCSGQRSRERKATLCAS